ncbi:MAG: 5'-nucleotidase C-terminal domain-containing protein [Rubrobacter sp.]|nr:5'-nucleotidase C-terminal domain-containing protein [Rubrobacter sp.]
MIGFRSISRILFLLVAAAFLAVACVQEGEPTGEEDASSEESSMMEDTTAEETTSSMDAAAGSGETVDVQILGFNDLEGNLEPYENDDGEEIGGVAYMDAYMDEMEAGNPEGTLRVHAGDLVGASPLISAYYHDEPTIEASNLMELDIGTLGNHEFDEGGEEMLRLIEGGQREDGMEEKDGENTSAPEFEGADYPYVSANVVDAETGEPIIEPYEVIEVNGVEIGFIGVVTTETPSKVVPDAVEPYEFRDLSDSINPYAEELREDGVEAIVVLAHSGNQNEDVEPPEGEIVDEAPQMSDAVDVVIAGDTPFPLDYDEDGTTVVQGTGTGADFMAVEMSVDTESGDVVESSGEVVEVITADVEPSEDIAAFVEERQEIVAEVSGRTVGEVAEAISTEQNDAGESPLGNLIADAQREYAEADIAFMNPGGIRADVPEGEITFEDLFTVQPFDNGLVRVEMTGEEVEGVLEQQFETPEATILQISGLEYTYDEEAPEGERITEIILEDGSEIDPEATYTAAINSFLSTGGDGFTDFTEIGESSETVGGDLEAFVGYVEGLEQPFSAPEDDGRITAAE